MPPSEGGELAGALVALQRDVVRHPVLPQVGLGPLAAPRQEAAQLGEDELAGPGLHLSSLL